MPRPLLKDRIARTLTGDCLKDFWLTPQFLLTASRRLFATTKRVFVCPLFLQGVSGARRLGRTGGQASFSRARVQPTAARLEDLECLSGVSVHCRLRTCARGEGDSRTIEVRDSIDTRVSLTFPPVPPSLISRVQIQWSSSMGLLNFAFLCFPVVRASKLLGFDGFVDFIILEMT